jgi:hypothetical protein
MNGRLGRGNGGCRVKKGEVRRAARAERGRRRSNADAIGG